MKVPSIDMTPRRATDQANVRWWTEKSNIHSHVWAIASRLNDDANARRQDNARHAQLYTGQARHSLSLSPSHQKPSHKNNRLTLNVIKSCIDTAAAKISQSRPRPSFLTSGGDFTLTKRAKQLTKYMDGLYDAEKVYQIGQSAFRDSLIFSTGIVKVYSDGTKVCFERILPDDILLDEGESFYGQPRQLHQRRYIHRDTLADHFPKQATAILEAQTSFSDQDSANPDMIAVVESWHLQSSPKSKDGRRTVTISNATLVDEAYDRESFPFAILRWNEPLTGFFGQGLAEELSGIQLEINKILRNIQSAQNLCAVPRVFLESATQVNGASLQPNPEGLSVVRFTGQAPIFRTADAMPSEVYSHLDRLVNKAYEITGISQLSAAAKKPAGLDSGVALREYEDIQSERFVLVGQRYEQFFIDLAKLAVEESQSLYEDNPQLNVLVAVKGNAEKIKWKEVNLKRDQYILRCFPTSLLPTTPAGRLQAVQELIQAEMVTKDEGMALLDFPDLERTMSLNTSSYEDAMTIVEQIVEDAVYTTPEPYMNLELCIKVGQSMYLKSRNNKVPEERLELLRRFIDDCMELQKSKQEQQAPLVTPPVIPQLAVPESLPQSDLLPMAPALV